MIKSDAQIILYNIIQKQYLRETHPFGARIFEDSYRGFDSVLNLLPSGLEILYTSYIEFKQDRKLIKINYNDNKES